jgi:hypothetical protein
LQNGIMLDPRPRKLFLALAANLICISAARAGLGGDAAGVVADAKALRGAVQFRSAPLFDVHEISAGGGLRVREYVNRDGIVFAVTWTGPVQPDLQQLLLTNFALYDQARSALTQPGLRRSLRIASADLVVETGGHLRAYSGRAYLPTRIPAGASANDLR